MSLTVALLAGLVLLLPGLTALVAWNFIGTSRGAKRPELQLTSVTALFLALLVSLLMHFLGFGAARLIWAAGLDLGTRLPASWPRFPAVGDPYNMAIGLALGNATAQALDLAIFVGFTFVECLFTWRLIGSKGLDLLLDASDLRGQGWVFQHVVRPSRYGYKPIAYVLTSATQGDYGIGYEGVVADIRQGENGELKSISLAEPQHFVYYVEPRRPDQPRFVPRLAIEGREWIGGIVALDAAVVRNIVVHSVPTELVIQLEALSGEIAESEL